MSELDALGQEALGEACCDAFRAALGLSPIWENLPDESRNAWKVAAQVVYDRAVADHIANIDARIDW